VVRFPPFFRLFDSTLNIFGDLLTISCLKGDTELTLEYFEDPKMQIPQWAINWVTSKGTSFHPLLSHFIDFNAYSLLSLALPKFLEKLGLKAKSYPEHVAKARPLCFSLSVPSHPPCFD